MIDGVTQKRQAMRKDRTDRDSRNGNSIAFCLNCNDMEDLALSEEEMDIALLRQRFDNCRNTGRFDGDFCTRLFIVRDVLDDISFFHDEDEFF
jgi:hypothetical protein